jgi:hypothetical protein
MGLTSDPNHLRAQIAQAESLAQMAAALTKLVCIIDMATAGGTGFGGEEIRVFRTESMR